MLRNRNDDKLWGQFHSMSTKEQQAFSCWAPQISLFILSVTKKHGGHSILLKTVLMEANTISMNAVFEYAHCDALTWQTIFNT